MQSRPTIKDVAARAGVSRQTVSRVINNKGEVSAETRTRVLAAIEELGYRPNIIARSMVAGQTRMLGCISPSLTDFTFASMIEGAQAEARRQGYFILTGSAPIESAVSPLLEEMLNRRVDGFLVLNPRVDGRFHHFLPLVERGTPVVYMKNTPNGAPVSSVCCDDRKGGYIATRHLIDLGHESIVTITGPENEECTIDRVEGYREAIERAGLSFRPEHVVVGDWSPDSGYSGIRELLDSGRSFSAVFSQNDRMAIGVIRALREAGMRVPEDVSVVGYDDIPLAAYLDPPLTTIRQPMEEFGRRAAQILIETIQNPDYPPEQAWVHACLVERASCLQPPRQVTR